MNWGDNVTLVGAARRCGGVTLSTKWRAMTKARFIEQVWCGLAPRLRRRDIVLLDNLAAHKTPEIRALIEQRGATVRYLPPYSSYFAPIGPVSALVRRRIRAHVPRSAAALCRVAGAARRVVTPDSCRQFFAHMGYGNSSGNRG